MHRMQCSAVLAISVGKNFPTIKAKNLGVWRSQNNLTHYECEENYTYQGNFMTLNCPKYNQEF